MKRLLFLVLLVLCAGSLGATDFLSTQDEYQTQMRRKLGSDTGSTGYLTDDNANAFIREGMFQILPITGARKQITSHVTARSTYAYRLDTTLVDIVGAFLVYTEGHTVVIKPLKYVPVSEWAEQEHRETGGKESEALQRPSFYDFTDTLILICPTPFSKAGDTIHIMGWHKMDDIDTQTNFSAIPTKYRTAILNYATWAAAFARTYPRATTLFNVLGWSLSKIGMAITSEGQVVPANQ
jgi:hypothetical protein